MARVDGSVNIETSKALQDLFYEYTHLPIGRKKIVCPYWINKTKLRIFGPYGGKGTPEQIVLATEAEAKKEGLDLDKMTKREILNFMRERRIGVDCSGFVFWMLNAFDLEKGGNGIADDIPESEGRFLEARASVKMLTNEKVSFPIERVSDIRVGDMIRLKRGKHVAIVLSLEKDALGNLKRVVYTHSSDLTEVSGVHSDVIEIIKKGKELKEQRWLERTKEGDYYNKFNFPDKNDGGRRLKIWG